MIHLFERDCSVQRRHQKVVEIAPAPNLDPELRERMCAHAVAFAKEIGYVNAGTVEFLLAPDGRYVFIEMNPRIQVEHTVTEEITDVDLVSSQLRIASGETLEDLGLSQDTLQIRGAALQCRITTEDPANEFRPDTGRITTYRSAGGAGVRLDGGTIFVGAEIGAHFDSMLVKLTCRGRDFPTAVRRARRALAEFRIRGVSTNIPFLQALLEEPDFQAGRRDDGVHRRAPRPAHRATSPPTAAPGCSPTSPTSPSTSRTGPAAPGSRRAPSCRRSTGRLPRRPVPATGCCVHGPQAFAEALRAQEAVGVTETTFRDAHQSLLATRVRTRDLMHVAPHVARLTPQLLSVEAWGGATYDVALRFLAEDPWDRLSQLREAMPNLPLQMLLRGRNTVGYTPYPTAVTDAFVTEAARTGIDIFRIFDALNDVGQMRPAIEAVRATGTAVAEVALCYTGDLTSPGEKLYTLDYYLRLAEQIAEAGAHVIAIKDMAGLLRAPAARTLVTALRERFDQPVHLHTHDTAGWPAGHPAGRHRRRGRRGRRRQRRDGRHHLPAADVEPGRRHRRHAPRHRARPRGRQRPRALLGGDPPAVLPVRVGPALADRSRLHARDPRRPALQPAPAGHRPRASATTSRRSRTCMPRPTASSATSSRSRPSSKVVGDLALALVGAKADPADFEANPTKYDIPDSVIGFLSGELGDPPGGWPEPFRTKALEGRNRQAPRHRAERRGQRRAQGEPAPHPQPAAVPRAHQGLPEVPRGLLRPRGPRHPRVPARPRGRFRARDRPRARQAAAPRPAVGLRRRRPRACAPSCSPWVASCGRCRCATSRSPSTSRPPRRPTPADQGPRRRAVRRRRQPRGRGGRERRGRRRGRHHRGDEDGGQHHRPRRGHGAAARHRFAAAGGGRRPPARARLGHVLTGLP